MRRFKHDALLPLLAAETVVTGRAAAGGGVDGDSVAPQHTLLLMPAVTDGSLQDVCDEVTHCRGRLPAVVLLSACAQAAAGLACMHAHTPPYAHRDVKPGNLLLMVRLPACWSHHNCAFPDASLSHVTLSGLAPAHGALRLGCGTQPRVGHLVRARHAV